MILRAKGKGNEKERREGRASLLIVLELPLASLP